jgi:uncharacterized membrane protein YbaN (DUF454 family)
MNSVTKIPSIQINPISNSGLSTPIERFLYLSLGWTCVGLGFIGIFVPLLPTTPFLIVSAFCFSKTSPSAKKWLESNKFLGKFVTEYEKYKIIPRRGKILSSSMMFFGWFRLLSKANFMLTPLVCIGGVILLATAVYVWRHPSSKTITRTRA